MRGAIAALVPGARFVRRERFSTLSYVGEKKISRMQPRSAIVGFSVESCYAIAELIRRQKGGAAVVMGALSPRTRNAQVAMYQNGDVDFLVATDAIGMGLNLDVRHVAFSSTTKFDGRRMRQLQPNELAQIAGRAGRHTTPGTFGVTGEAPPLAPEVVEAITESRFLPVRRLQWRNSDLRFGSVDALIASLEERTDNDWLSRARDADDVLALKALAEDRDVRRRAVTPGGVKLLWEVCRIPDFRGISASEHASMLSAIHGFLFEYGRVPDDWLGRQVARIDRSDGDIDALSKRLAYIRTWTYVAQRKGWVDDEAYWREATRAVEDRLSDALHGALTQRFVDRRTSVLLRKLKQKEALVAQLSDTGDVTVEGQALGRLEGFRFRQGAAAGAEEARAMRQAAQASLAPEFSLRADRFYNAPDTEIDYTEQGGLMWGEHAVGKLVAGDEPLRPRVQAFVDDEAGAEVRAKVERRLGHFVERRVATLMEPLVAMQRDETLTGLARGFAFRCVEAFGIIPRQDVAQEVRELDQEARAALRRHGVRFGQFTIFLPALLKPAPTRLRLVLWSLSKGLSEFPEAPPPGLVTIPVDPGAPEGHLAMAGYREAGERAIRIDMLERLADQLRAEDSRGGFEAKPAMLSITGTTLEQFARLMEGLGYRAQRVERPKRAPEAEPAGSEVEPAAETVMAAAGPGTEAVAAGAPGEGAEGAGEARLQEQPQPGDVPADVPSEVPPGPSERPGDAPGEVPPPPADPDVGPAPEVPGGEPPEQPDIGPEPEIPQPDPAPGGDPELPDPDAPQPGVPETPTEVPDAPSERPGDVPGEVPLPPTPADVPEIPPGPTVPGTPVEIPPQTPGMMLGAAAGESIVEGARPDATPHDAVPDDVALGAAASEDAAPGAVAADADAPAPGDGTPAAGEGGAVRVEADGATGIEPDAGAGTEAGSVAAAAETGAEAPAEMEVAYVFTWAGRARDRARGRGGRRDDGARPAHGRGQGQGDAQRSRRAERPGDGARAAEGGGADGASGKRGPETRGPDKRGPETRGAEARGKDQRGNGKRGPDKRDDKRGGQAPKRYSAAPGREARDRIDPDNPFAAALMALRNKE